jgi:hypothetical protein
MRIAKLFVRPFNSAAFSSEFMGLLNHLIIESFSHLVIESLKAFNDSMIQ